MNGREWKAKNAMYELCQYIFW